MTPCERCGYLLSQKQVHHLKLHKLDIRCQSCNAKPTKQVGQSKHDYCVPHQGEFDYDDNPMKNGKLFRPGVRKCGYSDCVRNSHIFVATDEIEMLIEKIARQRPLIPWDSPIWNDVRELNAGV